MAIKKKALDRLRAMCLQATINAEANTDEQALAVQSLYQDWTDVSVGDTLPAGSRINYGGVLYKVLQDHNKQETWTPTEVPSLYARVLIPYPDVIPEWEQPDAANAYAAGDKVTHNGQTWESLADNNVWEPGAAGTESLWKQC